MTETTRLWIACKVRRTLCLKPRAWASVTQALCPNFWFVCSSANHQCFLAIPRFAMTPTFTPTGVSKCAQHRALAEEMRMNHFLRHINVEEMSMDAKLVSQYSSVLLMHGGQGHAAQRNEHVMQSNTFLSLSPSSTLQGNTRYCHPPTIRSRAKRESRHHVHQAPQVREAHLPFPQGDTQR